MASLKTILQTRSTPPVETNLEQGKIWSYSGTGTYSNFGNCFCWQAPGTGRVIVEAIGAGGSGGRMCCCGGGSTPGNSGAYSKKACDTASGCWICGVSGRSCRNADAMCFRGCSESTRVWYSNGGCQCAEGGRGGISFCSTGTAPMCCLGANGWCYTYYNTYCGIICNYNAGWWRGNAYGGDTNKPGNIGCTTFWHCYPNCNCSTVFHVPLAPGYQSEDGAIITHGNDSDNGHSEWSGMALNGFLSTLNSTNKMPGGAQPWSNCWNGVRHCGCYDTQGCGMFVPHGTGGPAATQCADVRDNAWSGGDGIVKIKYIES